MKRLLPNIPVIGTAIGIGSSFLPRGGARSLAGGPAPKATFFGGECPPGRVLRRVSGGRDICVKRRRMNVGNAKALRRAIRRARGFEKLARKVLGFTSPKKPKGRAYFKKARR